MPQTMLGLLGLVLVTLLSFNQQRITMRGYDVRLMDEYQLAASGVMMHVTELIAARAFDENTTPEAIRDAQYVPRSANAMSNGNHFGSRDRGSEGCDLERPTQTPHCDDVDDLDGIRNQLVHARLRDGQTLPFEVSIDVYYVKNHDLKTPSNQRTLNKRVVLTARTPLLPAVDEIVRLERVVSYDPIKAEADFEARYGPLGTQNN